MAKVKADGPGVNVSISLSNVNANVNVGNAANGAIGALNINTNIGYAVVLNGATEIEVINNATLNVTNSELPLDRLVVNNGGTLTFNNSYALANAQTAITVGPNSTMTLNGIEMNLGQVDLDYPANFHFMHNNVVFHIQTPNVPHVAPMMIPDIHHLADLCEFLSQHDFNTQLPLEHTHALKLYEENKYLLDQMLIQNNINVTSIEQYMNTHFFEINSINHSFIDSDLQILPKNMIGEICSHLNSSDIN